MLFMNWLTCRRLKRICGPSARLYFIRELATIHPFLDGILGLNPVSDDIAGFLAAGRKQEIMHFRTRTGHPMTGGFPVRFPAPERGGEGRPG
jgi:hypothetical protein